MKINIEIDLPEDFEVLCTIYQIKPEIIIQAFLKEVSYPLCYSRTDAKYKWATYLFIKYLDLHESEYEVNRKLENQYLHRFGKGIIEALKRSNNDDIKAEEAGRLIMKQWLKAVIADRTKYITENL